MTDRDPSLDTLLDLNGQVLVIDAAGYWVRFVVTVVPVTAQKPHGLDYTMTRLRNLDYLSSAGDPQVLLAWIDGFPLWAQAAWALGVWGSVAGSLLLLLRSRHAVLAFAV